MVRKRSNTHLYKQSQNAALSLVTSAQGRIVRRVA